MAIILEEKELIPKPRKGLHMRCIYKPLFFFEESIKQTGFDCRSCGQCILSTTGFVCPMRCAKQLRNGPCGGASKGKCEVNTEKNCVWEEIFEGADSLNKVEPLSIFQKPIDTRLTNKSAAINWMDNRIEGMHLILPGKGKALYQLFRILFHIIKVRWRKCIHPSRYWEKHESHYLNV